MCALFLKISFAVRYITMRRDAVRYITMRRDAVRYITMRRDAMRYDSRQNDAKRCEAVLRSAVCAVQRAQCSGACCDDGAILLLLIAMGSSYFLFSRCFAFVFSIRRQ
jgi:hypothetical protein